MVDKDIELYYVVQYLREFTRNYEVTRNVQLFFVWIMPTQYIYTQNNNHEWKFISAVIRSKYWS